jgi:hypothetical protein
MLSQQQKQQPLSLRPSALERFSNFAKSKIALPPPEFIYGVGCWFVDLGRALSLCETAM